MILALAVRGPDGVAEKLEALSPLEELLLADIVGRPDEAEIVSTGMEELFVEIVENPIEAVEV